MKHRELSKFQIKAEITLMLQKQTSLDEMSREQQLKYLAKFDSIEDNDYVVEVLAKELRKADYKKGQVITLFLQELGSLEQLSEILWSYIKSPNSSDELRDLAGITLKNLGDATDPEEFLSYLENPKDIVDKETKKLLEVASVNPEAQIDFLDFLFSLPENEQMNLISSLQEDYYSECLVNVVIPTFESKLVPHMDEFLLKILGETKSCKAALVLKDFLSYSQDENLKKKANLSLNMLKLAGIDSKKAEDFDVKEEITQISSIYEFHTHIPDGLGNQAIVGSRIRPNGDILMMNVVVNDIHGILDCFGFYGISKSDFRRIIDRFQEKSTGIPVSPEYCKYIIEKAEKINKINNLPISYEYLAWKPILGDIAPFDSHDISRLITKWADEKFLKEGATLYKFPDFKHWFFEEDDHEIIKESLKNIINNVVEKKEFYIKNNSELEKFLEAELNKFMPEVFSPEVRDAYKDRLQNIAILFDVEELNHFRNISATLAKLIDSENNSDIIKAPFFREILKKTITEGLLRHQYNLSAEEKQLSNPWNLMKKGQKTEVDDKKFEKENIEEIIQILCGN